MTNSSQKQRSFELSPSIQSPLYRKLFTLIKSPLERLFALQQLGQMYAGLSCKEEDFVEQALATLGVSYDVAETDLAKIPKTGPVVLVANHPFGGIEGVILAAVLKKVRPDVKIMANFMLEVFSEMRDLFIFVDPFGQEKSKKRNIGPLRETLEWVRNGGALAVFPAGTVSHLHLQRRRIQDPPWSDTVARIVRKAEAPALPIFFPGSNSAFFQLLGLIHPKLRTAMLPHELLNKRNSTVRLAVGTLIPAEKLTAFETDGEMLSYLRLRTYILRNRLRNEDSGIEEAALMTKSRTLARIVPPKDPELLLEEVSSLPKSQVLLASGPYEVRYAFAQQIPHVLYEIGRLREATFRHVGEGSGKSIDLDEFDNHYLHLFLWNHEKTEVVGAYRLGQADVIVEHVGVEGLYTNTLFHYRRQLLEQMGPALELGRSFVRLEYQRSYSALLLLWKGIAHYVAANPDYKILFGPVTINNNYDSTSRQLMVEFLKANRFIPSLASLVKARNPLRLKRKVSDDLQDASTVVRDIDEVSAIVDEIENSQRGIPVLLRQYLRMGGKLLGFNIDPDFGYVLDGLILVDMTKTEPRILERYMGAKGMKSFLAYHGVPAGRSTIKAA